MWCRCRIWIHSKIRSMTGSRVTSRLFDCTNLQAPGVGPVMMIMVMVMLRMLVMLGDDEVGDLCW